jgi:hypothetical protein
MNGRVYDPVLGRFLSADPTVDGVEDAQGFNRYSYVGNNPMNATDPSGYFSLKDALKIVAIVAIAWVGGYLAIQAWGAATAASGAVTYGSSFAAALGNAGLSAGVINGVIGGAVGGFASGFAGSLLNGGSIGDAFKAGVIGGVAGAITGGIAGKIGDVFGDVANGSFENEFGRALAHGTAGGVAEEVQGGQFRHGFYAGFAGSAAGSIVGRTSLQNIEGGKGVAARTAIVATAGGTASALGGGKFANGAVTAAFQHLFNAEAHRGFWSGVKRFFGGDPGGGFLGTSLTPGEYAGAAVDGGKQGAMVYADRLLPFADPFADRGYYDPLDPNLQASQFLGAMGQQAVFTIAGVGVARLGAQVAIWQRGQAVGKWLSQGRYWRLGGSGGGQILTLRIGAARPPTPLNHIDLRLLPWPWRK